MIGFPQSAPRSAHLHAFARAVVAAWPHTEATWSSSGTIFILVPDAAGSVLHVERDGHTFRYGDDQRLSRAARATLTAAAPELLRWVDSGSADSPNSRRRFHQEVAQSFGDQRVVDSLYARANARVTGHAGALETPTVAAPRRIGAGSPSPTAIEMYVQAFVGRPSGR